MHTCQKFHLHIFLPSCQKMHYRKFESIGSYVMARSTVLSSLVRSYSVRGNVLGKDRAEKCSCAKDKNRSFAVRKCFMEMEGLPPARESYCTKRGTLTLSLRSFKSVYVVSGEDNKACLYEFTNCEKNIRSHNFSSLSLFIPNRLLISEETLSSDFLPQ